MSGSRFDGHPVRGPNWENDLCNAVVVQLGDSDLMYLVGPLPENRSRAERITLFRASDGVSPSCWEGLTLGELSADPMPLQLKEVGRAGDAQHAGRRWSFVR